MPEVTNATADVQLANPQITVKIDRDKASALGISASQVEDDARFIVRRAASLHDHGAEQSVRRNPGTCS